MNAKTTPEPRRREEREIKFLENLNRPLIKCCGYSGKYVVERAPNQFFPHLFFLLRVFAVKVWILVSLLFPLFTPTHAEHLASQLMDGDIGLVSARATALQYTRGGEFDKAAKGGEKALALAQDQYGPVSPVPASILDDLAAVYRHQARWREAEAQYKWSLAIREKVLGPDHPEVAESLDHLASLYVELARYEEAELLLKRALAIQEKTAGEKSSVVAQTLQQLGGLYLKTSQIPQAKAAFSRVLEIQEQANKPDSLGLVDVLKDLSQVALGEKDLKDAEGLLQRILKIKEKNFPVGHPAISDSQDDLADFYQAQGDPGNLEKARNLYEQALPVHKRVMGPDIYTSLPFFNRAAKTYLALGQYAEAEAIFKRELVVCRKVYGPDHPRTALVLADVAVAESGVSKDKPKAAPDLKEALKILQKSLGENHPLALQVKDRLSKLSGKSPK